MRAACFKCRSWASSPLAAATSRVACSGVGAAPSATPGMRALKSDIGSKRLCMPTGQPGSGVDQARSTGKTNSACACTDTAVSDLCFAMQREQTGKEGKERATRRLKPFRTAALTNNQYLDRQGSGNGCHESPQDSRHSCVGGQQLVCRSRLY